MKFPALLAASAVLAVAAPASAQNPQLKAMAAAPAAQRAKPTAADWRTPDPENVLVIDTNKGRILLELVPAVAPNHVQRVRELTREGLYNGRAFFRVIDEFMAQTGDPQDTGEGGSAKPDLEGEFMFRRGPDLPFALVASAGASETGFVGPLPVQTQSSMLMAMTADGKVSGWGLYCPGVAGMARAEHPNSANSQFFLMRQAYPSLEKRYTAFGRVISGLEVVRTIKVGEPVAPPQDRMERVRVLADIPAGERPNVRVIDPNSAWFKAETARVRAANGADFTACAIDIPAEVK
jgi:peptidylprolyl isomerase